MKFALIDLGTNSAKLFIYKEKGSKITLLRKHRLPVHFGYGVYHDGIISKEAAERALGAFEEFRRLIDKYEVDTVRAVATSAMRDAKDGAKLADKISSKTDIPLEIIKGDEEARLIALGIVKNIVVPDGPYALIDIGGGSTEISFAKSRKVLYSKSIKAGAARGQHKYFEDVPPKKGKKSVEKLRKNVREKLEAKFQGEVPDFKKNTNVYGSSGSIRALARIHANRMRKKATMPFGRAFLEAFIEETVGKSRDEILKIPKLEKKRVDIILSAAVLLDEVLDYLGLDTVVPVALALKDGMLEELCA